MRIDSQESPTQIVLRLARQEGFAVAGVAPAQRSAHEAFIRTWLAAGRHGEMSYLADTQKLEKRLDPTVLLPGAKSIICVADRYEAGSDAPGVATKRRTRSSDEGEDRSEVRDQKSEIPSGRIARYARGDDYHQIIKKRLHRLADQLRAIWPDEQFYSAVDTAPILEREHAGRSGIGWVGKNTLLLHPMLGSWLLLGEIVTTLALPTAENDGEIITDHCGRCRRCIEACPTQCIAAEGYQMDASRCISYITIEHRGPIDPTLHPLMHDWIAGCDVCQEVCPFNRQESGDRSQASGVKRQESEHRRSQLRGFSDHALDGPIDSAYALRPPAPVIPLLELLRWAAADRQAAFVRSALKRIKLDQLKRNAVIAAGNHLADHPGADEAGLRQRIQQLAADSRESELVRITARQVLERLSERVRLGSA